MKPSNSEDVRVLNHGLHSKRALKSVNQLFTTHDLKDPVLYHIILSGSQDKKAYQAVMKYLMQHIRTKCRAERIGAFEVGEEKSGLHAHAFVIIETADHFPSDLLDVREGKWIARCIKRTGISIRIEPPKNWMHGGQMFARMNTPKKLENCINWATYILKLRSKDAVPGRETYFGSEFSSNIAKREAQRQKHRDALHKCSKLAPPVAKVNDNPVNNPVPNPTSPFPGSPINLKGNNETTTPTPSRQVTGYTKWRYRQSQSSYRFIEAQFSQSKRSYCRIPPVACFPSGP